ncbi:pyridoxamine 5'-phosphate oxidase family protein [Sphaerisporangium corydalis]|uniref:Pyridoxamine 5'-phosphate oxidase family protein n=1 Tax=Sphaerisporangium corydalis TaxID=1441875 RepID=A0ABV9EJ49_9ACTN|nr:pyridoxamine 5'-phosphate oxidase family protein [Sphaerisporangium corydalis]
MEAREPVAELDARYSDPKATATPWAEARGLLQGAGTFWLSTVRPDGRPHVTPLLGIWAEGAMYFCTGPAERKAANLAANPHCVLTTGCNSLTEGLDVVVEGDATVVGDDALLRRLAGAYEEKYGQNWHFDVRDGAFHGEGGRALVYEVAPSKVLGFAKDPYGQTRWRF